MMELNILLVPWDIRHQRTNCSHVRHAVALGVAVGKLFAAIEGNGKVYVVIKGFAEIKKLVEDVTRAVHLRLG